jgi:hypothetical protein
LRSRVRTSSAAFAWWGGIWPFGRGFAGVAGDSPRGQARAFAGKTVTNLRFEALHGAIGHNLLRAELNRSVKDRRWMVLSLNRLTCVRYGLPLGYGGFRERSLEEMCRWMLDDVEDPTEPGLQETLDIA